jgi:predicted nucleic acid-binding protein
VIVVSDSSALISLARVGWITLLPKLFGTVLIPEAVCAELENSNPDSPARNLRAEPWLKVIAVKRQSEVATLLVDLDRGEAEAVILALEQKADTLLVDERRAREFARRKGLTIIGALGVLVQAKRRGLVQEIGPITARMRTQGRFWVSEALEEQVLRSVGETRSK